MNSELEEICLKIINSKRIVILTHESPDGDAIGSSLALYNALLYLGKDVDVICDEYSRLFSFLKSSSNILSESNKKYDLGICLDCASRIRLYNPNNVLGNCESVISIDHHVSNSYYGDLNYVLGECPANCQIIYKLLKKLDVFIDKEIGECLLTGIVTDTGGFQNSSINSETFMIVASLFDIGVNVSDIYYKVFRMQSKAKYLLSRIADSRLEFFYDDKIAFTYILIDDEKKTHALVGDHEGIVNIGRNIEGVEVSIFFREYDKGFKVSLRSNSYVDVSEIARVFDGGGHVRASGFTINDSLDNAKELVLKEVYKKL